MKAAKNGRIIKRPAVPEMELQELVLKTIHVHGISVEVVICAGEVGTDGVFKPKEAPVVYNLLGAQYKELMSASPAWAPNKPEGMFRDLDILQFVDELKVRPVEAPVRKQGPLNEMLAQFTKAQAKQLELDNAAAAGGKNV